MKRKLKTIEMISETVIWQNKQNRWTFSPKNEERKRGGSQQ